MKICLKLTDFISEYLKVGCIETVFGVEERETKRPQNIYGQKKEGNPALDNTNLVIGSFNGKC